MHLARARVRVSLRESVFYPSYMKMLKIKLAINVNRRFDKIN